MFLDTSVLFSGIWSEVGGTRLILKLGESEALKIVIGSRVLEEIDEVLRVKYPAVIKDLVLLLDRCRVEVSTRLDNAILIQCESLTIHKGDARVLAESWCAGVDYFTTHDKIHLSKNQRVVTSVPFPVGSPGDFLAWYRKRLSISPPAAE